LGSGDLFKIRQPFSESARIKFDQSAQDYGDKLYNSQYDPRMRGAERRQGGGRRGAGCQVIKQQRWARAPAFLDSR
jgi:hypothetical protein